MKSKCYTVFQNLPLNNFLTILSFLHVLLGPGYTRTVMVAFKSHKATKVQQFHPGFISADSCQTIQVIFL